MAKLPKLAEASDRSASNGPGFDEAPLQRQSSLERLNSVAIAHMTGGLDEGHESLGVILLAFVPTWYHAIEAS
jgi:hypothetical protein